MVIDELQTPFISSCITYLTPLHYMTFHNICTFMLLLAPSSVHSIFSSSFSSLQRSSFGLCCIFYSGCMDTYCFLSPFLLNGADIFDSLRTYVHWKYSSAGDSQANLWTNHRWLIDWSTVQMMVTPLNPVPPIHYNTQEIFSSFYPSITCKLCINVRCAVMFPGSL